MGDIIVSLQAQTFPYFQLREKVKCIDKVRPSLKLLPEIRKSEQNVSQFQITCANSGLHTQVTEGG